jgi:flagellar hook-basal body complex protein FliE
MSQEEIGIRDLLLEISKKQADISEKQEKHISASNEFRESVNNKLTQIDTHWQYTKESVDQNIKDISSLKDSRTTQRAVIWTFGLIWTGILGVFSAFKSH